MLPLLPASLSVWHVAHLAAKSCLPRSKSPFADTPQPESTGTRKSTAASAAKPPPAGVSLSLDTSAGILSMRHAGRTGVEGIEQLLDRVESIGTFGPRGGADGSSGRHVEGGADARSEAHAARCRPADDREGRRGRGGDGRGISGPTHHQRARHPELAGQ